jgi:hypothetical protein
MEDQTHERVPLNLMTIQGMARSLFEAVKRKYKDPNAQFVSSLGWFNKFKARINFHSVKMNGETDTNAAEMCAKVLRKLREKVVLGHSKSLTSTKLGYSGRKS